MPPTKKQSKRATRTTKDEQHKPLTKKQISAVKDSLHEKGMLITISGPLGNCLRLQPALTISSAQLDTFVAALKATLQTVRESSR